MEDAVVKMDRTAVVPAKSKLTIDLANRVSFGVETNKSSVAERRGVFHHLLRDFLYDDRVSGRPKLPSTVGGPNSFIKLVSNRYNQDLDVFEKWNLVQCESKELRHHFFFNPDLDRYQGKLFDETMYDELKNEFSDQNTGWTVVEEVKGRNENTKYLTEKQLWKIQRVEAMEACRRRCRRETARFRRPKFGKDKLYYRT